jgi:hypothetical protein
MKKRKFKVGDAVYTTKAGNNYFGGVNNIRGVIMKIISPTTDCPYNVKFENGKSQTSFKENELMSEHEYNLLAGKDILSKDINVGDKVRMISGARITHLGTVEYIDMTMPNPYFIKFEGFDGPAYAYPRTNFILVPKDKKVSVPSSSDVEGIDLKTPYPTEPMSKEESYKPSMPKERKKVLLLIK